MVGNMKIGGRFDCNYHEVVLLKIEMGGSKAKSRTTTMYFRCITQIPILQLVPCNIFFRHRMLGLSVCSALQMIEGQEECLIHQMVMLNFWGIQQLLKLASSNFIKHIKGNWKFLYQERKNTQAPACAQGYLARSSSKKKDLRVLVDNELTTGHLCWRSPCVSLQKERSKASLIVLGKVLP